MSAVLTMPTETESETTAKVTFPRVVNSEWIKLRSLRSTTITLIAAVVAIIGFGLLATWVWHHNGGVGPRGRTETLDPTGRSLSGVTLGQLVIGVLGVLVITGEYATGMIRATLSAVPKRLPVLWAKALVFGAVAFVLSLIAVVIAFLSGQAILGGDVNASLGDDGVLRTVIGAAVYLTGIGLLGLALGALLRHTAGAISTLVGLILIAPGLVQLLPNSWSDAVTKYLPSNAGGSFMTVHTDSTSFSPWAGLVVFVIEIAVALAAAAFLLRKRDA